MAEYTPDYVGTVTKYVFVESPPSMTPPGELALRAYEASEGVLIKETCFGLQVTGEPESVDRLIEEIRSFDRPISSSRTGGVFLPGGIRDAAGRISAERGRATSGTNGSSVFCATSPAGSRSSTGVKETRRNRHRPHAGSDRYLISSDYKN